jgi:hypothetical protein
MVVNLIVFASSFIPTVHEWVSSHPIETLTIVSGINVLLRAITKDKVTLFPD